MHTHTHTHSRVLKRASTQTPRCAWRPASNTATCIIFFNRKSTGRPKHDAITATRHGIELSNTYTHARAPAVRRPRTHTRTLAIHTSGRHARQLAYNDPHPMHGAPHLVPPPRVGSTRRCPNTAPQCRSCSRAGSSTPGCTFRSTWGTGGPSWRRRCPRSTAAACCLRCPAGSSGPACTAPAPRPWRSRSSPRGTARRS